MTNDTDTTSMDTDGEKISWGTESLSWNGIWIFLLAAFVAFSLVLNVLVAFSAIDGSRMLAQVAEDYEVPVDRLGLRGEHFDSVQDRYEHTLQGGLIYYFEFMGGQWAAISIAATVALSWMWRRRGLPIAFAPLVITIALLAVVSTRWEAVSKIAAFMS